MRFERIKVRGMGPFKREVDVDLAGIDGQLVAICGPNGAGKTTLLELLAGALYRECPTRGTLADLATARDSFVEVHAVNGQAFTVRQQVDGLSKKGEALVTDADGTPLVESAKVSHFDKWAADHLTPSDVLYSSSFAVQGRRGFLDLKPAERKDLLVEVLGLKRLDRMADNAREQSRSAKAALEAIQARLADLESPDMGALEAQATQAAQRVEQAVESVRGARVALERARAAAGDAAKQAELAEQRRAAEKRLGAARKQLSDLEERIENNRGLLGRGEEIRAAIARAAELDPEVEAAREACRAADQAFTVAKADETTARSAHQRAADAVGQAQSLVTRLQARLKDRDAVKAASERVDLLRAQKLEAEVSVEALEGSIATNQELLMSGKERRVQILRRGLSGIADPDFVGTAQGLAQETLNEDDDVAESQADAPARIASTKATLDAKRRELSGIVANLSAAERLAARAGEIAQADADMAQARLDQSAAAEQQGKAATALDLASKDRAATNRAAEVATDAWTAKRGARMALDPTLALRPRLEQAEARIEELTAQVEPARAAVAQTEAELATLPVVDPTQAVDVGAHERTLASAEGSERAARDHQGRMGAAIERAQETLKGRQALEQQVQGAEDQLADWTRLAQDLGKDGLQAMEIDAALPEWTAIANSLLHSCLGPRFTVELRTDRLSSDGKKVLEDLEARVIDTVNGRDADATTYSGGELVLVGSALALGLTTLACRRSGVERPTICLDEAGAALDAANGRAWIAMIRMAATQIGADKVLYISHSAEAQDLADARIRISDGVVTVD